jgi:hypothetical protein
MRHPDKQCRLLAAFSFYPYFFSPREERGIINRLLRMDEQHA